MIRTEGVGNGAFQLRSHLLHLAFADGTGKYNLYTTHVESPPTQAPRTENEEEN
jgi:hypothetical protein